MRDTLVRDRRPVRRRALRHGDARAGRGRSSRAPGRTPRSGGPCSTRLLEGSHPRRSSRRHPRVPVRRRGLLGWSWTLQEVGFHFSYDKGLYDRMSTTVTRPGEGSPAAPDPVPGPERFIENHDEARAADTFAARAPARAAAVVDVDAARAPGCTTTASSRAAARTSRCSSPAARSEPADDDAARVLRHAAGARSPTPACATATGSSVRVQRLAGQPQRRAARRLVLAHERAAAPRRREPLRPGRHRPRSGSRGSDLAGRTWRLRDRARRRGVRARRRRAPGQRSVRRDEPVGVLLLRVHDEARRSGLRRE